MTEKEKEKSEKRRERRPDKNYKNANQLFQDKLTAFIYVLLCEWWWYKSIDDQPQANELFAVQYLYAVALDSIVRIKEGEEFYYLNIVLDRASEQPTQIARRSEMNLEDIFVIIEKTRKSCHSTIL